MNQRLLELKQIPCALDNLALGGIGIEFQQPLKHGFEGFGKE